VGAGFQLTGNVIHLTGAAETITIPVVSSKQATQLIFSVPHTASYGTYDVHVTTSRGGVSNTLQLGVQERTRPTFPLPQPCLFDKVLCPTTHTYVVLGDSQAVGLSALKGYVYRYEDYIEDDNAGVTVDLDSLARNGWTSTDLLQALRSDTAMRTAVSNADVVTWNIGGNDMRLARDQYIARTCGGVDNQDCLRTTSATLQSNFTAITDAIVSLRRNTEGITRSMDLFYPFVNDDRARDTWQGDGGRHDFDELNPYVQDINAHIGDVLTSRGVPYARVYGAFNGNGSQDPNDKGYISFDGYHPNDAGHTVIADRLRALGYQGLRAGSPAPAPRPTPAPTPILRFPQLPTGGGGNGPVNCFTYPCPYPQPKSQPKPTGRPPIVCSTNGVQYPCPQGPTRQEPQPVPTTQPRPCNHYRVENGALVPAPAPCPIPPVPAPDPIPPVPAPQPCFGPRCGSF